MILSRSSTANRDARIPYHPYFARRIPLAYPADYSSPSSESDEREDEKPVQRGCVVLAGPVLKERLGLDSAEQDGKPRCHPADALPHRYAPKNARTASIDCVRDAGGRLRTICGP